MNSIDVTKYAGGQTKIGANGMAVQSSASDAGSAPVAPTDLTAEQVKSNLAKFDSSNTSPVSSISTDQGKQVLADTTKQHEADLQNIQASKIIDPNKQIIDQKSKENAITDARNVGGLTPEEISGLGGDVKNYDFHAASGLYVPKGTEGGISGLLNVSPDEQAINTAFDAQKGLLDASTQNVIKSITDLYGERKQALQQQNTNATESFRNLGLRTGMARYSGGSFKGMLNSVEQSGLQRLTNLASEEAGKIAEAERARTNGEYTLFAKKRDEVTALKKEKATTIEKLRTEAVKENQKIKDTTIRSSRDSAIAGLLQQGISDPSQMLDYLNFDQQGNRTGDFTIKEVTDSLKALSPDGDLKNLSATTRDFFILKGHNQLPADITALPEDQQLMAYVKSQKSVSTSGKLSTNKITLSEAKSKGLPLSTVGMSEQDIADTLQEPTAPHWFTEKMQNEAGSVSLDPSVVETTWEKYRQNFMAGSHSTANSAKPTPAVIGQVRALKSKGASEKEVSDFISFKGYDPADPAFQ